MSNNSYVEVFYIPQKRKKRPCLENLYDMVIENDSAQLDNMSYRV